MWQKLRRNRHRRSDRPLNVEEEGRIPPLFRTYLYVPNDSFFGQHNYHYYSFLNI